MATLNERKAYEAMFAFLRNRWQILKSDELGSLLGEMTIVPEEWADRLGDPTATPEHRTADPAIWWEWMKAIEEVEAGEPDGLYFLS